MWCVLFVCFMCDEVCLVSVVIASLWCWCVCGFVCVRVWYARYVCLCVCFV